MGKIGPKLTAFDSPHLSETNTGLGNVLFQIASTYGMSKMLGCEFHGRHVYEFAEKLKNNFGFRHGETILRNFIMNKDEQIYGVMAETENHHKLFDIQLLYKLYTVKHLNVLTFGYLESPLYFYPYQNEIRKLLEMDAFSRNYLKSKYPFLFDPNILKIAIHVRGGCEAIAIDENYYKNAIEFMQKKYPTAEFLLFTNDETNKVYQYCLVNLEKTHRIREREDYLELWAFSLAQHAICCFSTFSWWGAFLIQNKYKDIIVPMSAVDFMKKTYKVSKEKVMSEFYFPEYILLDDHR